ncbi:NAD(P)/FAD-dependent oxidoreductase [Rhodococcus sovatensis]|uniref:FAD-dependent oxidoreductase n=1 Tax=Rhodococcus sovatensis TaxID=1805840 RepID=A0ABZ2PI14_9NOCA
MTPNHIVVIGGSLAGARALEAARRLGFAGRLTLVGAEAHVPYDRPPLSKDFLDADKASAIPYFSGAEDMAKRLDVQLLLGKAATGIDLTHRKLRIDESTLDYDAALIATGASARALSTPPNLNGVSTLRTVDDAQRVRAAMDRGARVVVIGAGFIGSEVASAVRKRGSQVTMIEALPVPLARAVGRTAGQWLSAVHARHGTELICGVAVDAVVGNDTVEGVLLADGRSIPADLVVVGIGAIPATDWLADSGLDIENGILCDATMRAADSVWAAGDVSRWYSQDFKMHLRVEHWTNAADQGAHAMRNLLDPAHATPYRHIPYFWSDWYGHRIQLAGLAVGEPTVVAGDTSTDKFVALFRDGERLVGALCLNRRADVMRYRALIAEGGSWTDGLELARQRNAVVSANA